MKPKPSLKKSLVKAPAGRVVKDIRRQTRRHFSADDYIRIVLESYFLPGDLEQQIEAFIKHYDHERYQESLAAPQARRIISTQ